MDRNKIDDILRHFADKTSFALELAHRDALVNGMGFLSIDRDGNVVYHDYQEAYELAKATKSAVEGNR